MILGLILCVCQAAAEPFFLNQPLHISFNGWNWGTLRKDIPDLVQTKAENDTVVYKYTQTNFRFGSVPSEEISLLFHEERLFGSVLTFKRAQERTLVAYLRHLYGPGTPVKDGLKWEESGLVIAISPEDSEVKVLFLQQGLLARALRNAKIGVMDPNQALLMAAHFGETALVKSALGRGGKVEVDKPSNALLRAAEGGQTEVFDLIFAAVEKKPEVLSGALRAALIGGNPTIVKRLLDAGANPNAEGANSSTPLMDAASAPFAGREVVELLVRAGAAKEHLDDSGQSALHHAASTNNTRLLGLLRSYGLDVNAADNDGRTPLICAADQGHVESVRELIHLGARLDLRDRRGQNPFQRVESNLKGGFVLSRHRQEQVLELLRTAKK